MVFFFIADLALSLALKATTWCLGKTYDGFMYLVSRRGNANDDDNGDEFVVISLEDYRALRGKRRTVKAIELEPTPPPPASTAV